jgi:hypothetical protein
VAIDSDNPVSLPTPPPPRPAARREAIDAALRKFEGAEDAAIGKRPERSWWAAHQRQLGALATAAIIAVVSVPVALTVLRDQPSPAPQAKAPAPRQKASPPVAAESQPEPPQADQMAPAEVPRSKLPLEPHEEAAPVAPVAGEQKAANAAPALAVAAPPPAPPPPPPPAPAPERDDFADQAADQSIVVSGSRVQQPEPSSQHGRLGAKRAAEEPSPIAIIDVYGKFLFRLQSAVRSGNLRAVSALIAFPLRVNTSEGPRTYRDRKSIEDDFGRIFTPRVRQAILNQRPDRLFVRHQGAMIGDGEVWLDQTCRNAQCSPPGPVRIKAVNP